MNIHKALAKIVTHSQPTTYRQRLTTSDSRFATHPCGNPATCLLFYCKHLQAMEPITKSTSKQAQQVSTLRSAPLRQHKLTPVSSQVNTPPASPHPVTPAPRATAMDYIVNEFSKFGHWYRHFRGCVERRDLITGKFRKICCTDNLPNHHLDKKYQERWTKLMCESRDKRIAIIPDYQDGDSEYEDFESWHAVVEERYWSEM